MMRHIRTVSSCKNNNKVQGDYFDDGKTDIINRTRSFKLIQSIVRSSYVCILEAAP